MPYVNNKGTDQPVHRHSLISAIVVPCLDSIRPLVSMSEISSPCLASVAAQAGLCLIWSQTPKTGSYVGQLKRQTFSKTAFCMAVIAMGQKLKTNPTTPCKVLLILKMGVPVFIGAS